MDTQTLNEGESTKVPETPPPAPEPQGVDLKAVPAHIIPAELPHPNIQGGILTRGIKYLHHFEIELISDGQRLWAAASAEGKKVLADIEGENQAASDAAAAARAAPPMTAATTEAATQAGATDPNAKPAQ